MKKILTLTSLFLFAFIQAQTSDNQNVNPKEWHHASFEDTGIYGVNTQKAWDFLKEKKRKATPLTVGILDSGMEYDHEDLKNNMWVNPKEKAGNKKDDDKNGYIDDIHGWNFIGGANGNVSGDTMESVRYYNKLKSLFETKDESLNEKNRVNNPEKYADYINAKTKNETKLIEAKSILSQLNAMSKDVKLGIENLEKEFGSDKIVTEEALSNFQPSSEAMAGLYIFALIPKESWDGKKMSEVTSEYLSELQEGIKYYESQVNYHYNTNFDSREIVGDNYDNKSEKYYGNNDVKAVDYEHGTHVGGIISAERGNGIGMDGIAGNSVKLMSVRTVPDGDERDKDVANAIRYAVDNGAKILNMSFGKDFSPEKELVWEAMKYAGSKGVLIVKAAGNDNLNIDEKPHYPTNFDESGNKITESLITVGASTRDALVLKSSFSNYGKKSVDVFAPGSEVYSTYPTNTYKSQSGTSMASPVVAGVAALVWSHYPELSALELKEIILNSVNEDPQLTDFSVTGGVVDAYKAVQLADEKVNK